MQQNNKHASVEGVSIRPVRVEDIDALAALYAASFEDNPAYWSIFQEPRKEQHKHSITWLFQRRAALVIRSGAQYLCALDGAGALIAAGGLVRRSQQANLWDMICCGLLEWPFRFGLPSLQRLLSMEGALGKEDHSDGSMVMMAVSPAHQGSGIGSAVLAALLRDWDAAHSALGGDGDEQAQRADEKLGSVALNTQLPGAVRFYERHGFKLTEERTMHGAECKCKQQGQPSSEPVGGDSPAGADGGRAATAGCASKEQAAAGSCCLDVGQPSWPPPSCYISRNMMRNLRRT